MVELTFRSGREKNGQRYLARNPDAEHLCRGLSGHRKRDVHQKRVVPNRPLAFPIISLILALVLGRVKLSSLGIRDLAGFALLVAGYVVIMSKPQPQL